MIFVDVETTGIDRVKCGLLSIGAITLDGKHELHLECRPNPGLMISSEALAINGQSKFALFDRDLSENEAVKLLIHWACMYEEKPILAGYNLNSFDVMFLHKAWNGTFNMDWPLGRRFVDVHSIAYALHSRSFSADELSRFLDIEPEAKPHNALSGARHARKLYFKLRKEIHERY